MAALPSAPLYVQANSILLEALGVSPRFQRRIHLSQHLYRYSPRQKSSFFDVKDLDQREDDPRDDAVTVSEDSLVHPNPKGKLMHEIFLWGLSYALLTILCRVKWSRT